MDIELTLLSRVSFRGQEITAPRVRGLLALLAAEPRTGASNARLVAGLWPDEQPENPTKALQVVVTRARAALGPDVIASTPTGYRLELAEEQVDASALVLRASGSAERARSGDHASALAEAEAGLSLWDGAPDGVEDGDDPLTTLRARRLPAYRSLTRERALALARLGRRTEAVDALTAVFAQRPRDEEVLLELLRCEAATVGPSAALDRYEAYRRTLRDELGTDPGPGLRSLHGELLAGTAPTVRGGVLQEPNQLLGRGGDIDAVLDLVRASRVTSIVGPGGLGKTRLAHAVSRAAAQPVVQLVPLAGVGTDADVAAEVAAALGVGEARRGPVAAQAPTGDPVAGIVAALGPGPALLVLDNCEHVVSGAAELVRRLVSSARELRVLTTSRAPLDLSSESVYPLPELDSSTAVELFSQRARAARPGVELPADRVAEIVRHLDGLPLAIELAAARVRVMSVAEIAERITDRLALLRGGPRDAPERHRTLRAVVDWSWALLDPEQRAAMSALAVFPGGFTAGAANAVLGDGDTLGLLGHLVDQSLLRTRETLSGTRFQMLETVREFAAAQRDERETRRVTGEFLGWARDLGIRHHDSLFGPDPYSIVDTLRAEQDNLMQAVRVALARGDAPTVAATSALLEAVWVVASNYTRMAWLATETSWLLSHYRPEPELVEPVRTSLALSATYALLMQGTPAARPLVALRRLPPARPDTMIRATATILVAAAEDVAKLVALCDSDEPLVAGAANGAAGYLWENTGDLERAVDSAYRMLDAFGGGGMPWLEFGARARIAELCLQLERGEEALAQLTSALPISQRLWAWSDVVGLEWWMVLASLQLGDVDGAEEWLGRAGLDGSEDPATRSYGFGVRAEILLARGAVEAGLELWREALVGLGKDWDPMLRRFPSGADPWTLEAWSVAVVAHARHDRLGAVAGIAAALPGHLSAILADPVPNPPTYLLELSVCGTILLALSTMDLNADPPLSGERIATAVRMTALAERLRYLRAFHHTMSSAVARQAARDADEAAYQDAVSRYAAMDRTELRAIALELLTQRMGSRA